MVLAGYGGASLLFFGVSPSVFSAGSSKSTPTTAAPPQRKSLLAEKTAEEEQLANAVDAAEAEAVGDGPDLESLRDVELGGGESEKYSWWDVLLGKHDQEIFEQSTAHSEEHQDSVKEAELRRRRRATAKGKMKMKATAVSGLFIYFLFYF